MKDKTMSQMKPTRCTLKNNCFEMFHKISWNHPRNSKSCLHLFCGLWRNRLIPDTCKWFKTEAAVR